MIDFDARTFIDCVRGMAVLLIVAVAVLGMKYPDHL